MPEIYFSINFSIILSFITGLFRGNKNTGDGRLHFSYSEDVVLMIFQGICILKSAIIRAIVLK